MIASVMRPWMPVESRSELDGVGHERERTLTVFVLVGGRLGVVVAGPGFEPGKLSRRIYSPLPLAARATCRGAPWRGMRIRQRGAGFSGGLGRRGGTPVADASFDVVSKV